MWKKIQIRQGQILFHSNVSMLPGESLCFLAVSQELSIKMNCLCVCLSFTFCVPESIDIGLLMDSLLNLTLLWPWSFDRNFRRPVCNKTVRGDWEGIEEVMNACTKSSADRQLIPSGSQSEADIDGRDSWDGWVPAGETAMSDDTGETTPTADKLSDERFGMTVWAWACICLFMAACLCLFVSVWGRGRWKSEKMGLSQTAGQIMSGNLCIHVSALRVCGLWERVNVRQAISGTKMRLSMASASVAPLSPPAYCDPPCLELGSGYDSATSTWTPEEECSIPSTDRANWLLCQRPYYTIPLLDWQRFYSVCLRLCVKPTDDISTMAGARLLDCSWRPY